MEGVKKVMSPRTVLPSREVGLPGIGSETVVLVTGGTGAIGEAVASAFGTLGAAVAVVSRTGDRLSSATSPFGSRRLGIAADVSANGEAERVVAETVAAWGHLDVVVQCAAVSDSLTPLEGIRASMVDRLLATNVKGIIMVAQAAAAVMRPRESGTIVNVASISARRVMPGHVVYGASKAAVVQATRQLAAELGPHGLRVNSVSPGQTPTVLAGVDDLPGEVRIPSLSSDVSRIPSRRRGTLPDYVGPILFLASDLAGYVNGIDLLVDGGASVLR